jgi:hypothetical protein
MRFDNACCAIRQNLRTDGPPQIRQIRFLRALARDQDEVGRVDGANRLKR